MGRRPARSSPRSRHDLIGRLERWPVVRILLLAGGVAGAVTALVAAGVWGYGRLVGVIDPDDPPDPHRAEYAALEKLDLDVRLEYFESSFGTARSVVDLCESTVVDCEATRPAGALRLFIHETDAVTIRALFEGNTLELYLVTAMAKDFRPEVRWLDFELGDLSTFTVEEALAATGVEPTDMSVFFGPQSTSYADVTAVGAPGKHRGLVLAHAPLGVSASYDSEAALQIASAPEPSALPEVVAAFRAGTKPNTYGEFRDDGGLVGTAAADAEMVRTLLHLGTEL